MNYPPKADGIKPERRNEILGFWTNEQKILDHEPIKESSKE
jgi:hypothetical protein